MPTSESTSINSLFTVYCLFTGPDSVLGMSGWADSGPVNKDPVLGKLTGQWGEEQKETFVAFGIRC